MTYIKINFLALMAAILAGGFMMAALAEEEQAADAPAEAVEAPTTNYTLTWNGPRSLQTLVDERHDTLRDRREAHHDNLRALYGMSNPWMDLERDQWRAYSDQMRDIHRAHRDAVKFQTDLHRNVFNPWSRGFHEDAEARHFAMQMDNLDRQELMDNWRFAYEPLPW